LDVIILRGQKLEMALGLVVDGLQRQIEVTAELTHATRALAEAAADYRAALDSLAGVHCPPKASN
jgi:hypothetical protein